jgi:hypothetical protein
MAVADGFMGLEIAWYGVDDMERDTICLDKAVAQDMHLGHGHAIRTLK